MNTTKIILVYGLLALSMMACNSSQSAQQAALTADGQNAVILVDPPPPPTVLALVPQEPNPTIVASCNKCHGVDGNGTNPTFSRLGAQSEEYIVAELTAYRAGARTGKDAKMFMVPVAKKLTEQDIADLAHFYATRPAPAPIAGDAALIAQGEQIYKNGAGAVASCVACHGDKAEGKGTGARLAGQFPKEFTKQIGLFKSGERKSDIMSPIGAALTPEQVTALATYLGSLQ